MERIELFIVFLLITASGVFAGIATESFFIGISVWSALLAVTATIIFTAHRIVRAIHARKM